MTKDFLLSRLPPEILSRIDIKTLRRENTSFLDEKLRAYYSDIVFKVKTVTGNEGYLFFLLEEQTKPDELTPLRLLEYDVSIMRYDVEQQIEAKKDKKGTPITLPVIFNFVVYRGKEYKYPKRLIDAFRTPSLLYRMFEYQFLVHFRKEKEEKIMKDGEAALAELLIREGYRKDFCKYLVSYPKISDLINESTYARSAIMYMLDRDPHDVDDILKKIINLDPEIKDSVMTALQKIRTEGEEKGLKLGIIKGKKEEKKKIAKQMISKNTDKKFISEVTGLSLEEIEELILNTERN